MMSRGSLTTQQAIFYRCMATLYNAGIHITRSLRILSEQIEHPVLKTALADIVRRVESGRRLSEAMAQHGLAFPLLHSNLVALGEQTGSLHLVLEKLATQSEKSNELRGRLRAALTYPMVVFVLAMALLFTAPALIFKDLLRLLQDMQVELPLATRVMISASQLVSSPWILLPLLVLAAVATFLWKLVHNDRGWRRRVEGLILRLPILGPTIRASVVCDFTRSLATCCSTGVPILKGLELSARAADHLLFQDGLLAARDRMRDGASLNEALQAADFFPAMTVQMVAVGEESGRLSAMLERVAALTEAEVEQCLTVATAALQPIMMLFIGVVVGFVVVATMTPMLQVVNTL